MKGKLGTSKLAKQQSSDVDPLKNIALELSEEVSEDREEQANQLEQTIIIGEMEEVNIFDELKMEQTEDADNTITLSKQDLKSLIDTIKMKHKAEMDAIIIEQTSYKRII